MGCALSGDDSQMGWLVYILGSPGPLQWTLLCDWEFLPLLQLPQVFTAKGIEAFFSHTGTLGGSLSSFSVVPPRLSTHEYEIGWSASLCLVVHPRQPGFLSPPAPTGLDECFFFNSLVVRLPYSSIFWQF